MSRFFVLAFVLALAGCSSPDHDASHEDSAATEAHHDDGHTEAAPVAFAELDQAAADDYARALDRYLQISARLAADTTEGVPALARETADALEAMLVQDPAGAEHVAAALPHARALAEARTMDDTRDHFGLLSPHMDQLVLTVGPPAGTEIYRFVCGMADAPEGGIWLQAESEPSNPYFGSAMLRCARTLERVPDPA